MGFRHLQQSLSAFTGQSNNIYLLMLLCLFSSKSRPANKQLHRKRESKVTVRLSVKTPNVCRCSAAFTYFPFIQRKQWKRKSLTTSHCTHTSLRASALVIYTCCCFRFVRLTAMEADRTPHRLDKFSIRYTHVYMVYLSVSYLK